MRETSHEEQALALLIIHRCVPGEFVPEVGGDGFHRDISVQAMNGGALHFRRIVGHVRFVHQGELDGLPVLGGFFVLPVPGQLILSPLPQEMEIVSVVDHLQVGPGLDEINIFRRDVRTVQVDQVQILLVMFDPLPDTGLHLLSVQDLHAHLSELRGVGLLVGKVVAEELHHISLLQEHADILPGRPGPGVPVVGGHIVIHHQEDLLSLAALPGAEGIRVSGILALLRELRFPFFLQLFRILHLVALQAGPLYIGAVGYTFKVGDDGLRLIYDAVSVLPDFESQVRVLAVGRGIAFVETADLLPEAAADHDGGAGDIVHVLHVVEFRKIRILQAPVVPAGGIAPDDAARFLQPSVRVHQLRSGHANGGILLQELHKPFAPALIDLRVVVQEEQVLAPRLLRRLVAVPEKALVHGIAADDQALGKVVQILRRVSGDIVRDDHFEGDTVRVLKQRHQAGVGVADLVVDRQDDADQRLTDFRELQFPVFFVDVADGEIAFDQVAALRGRDHLTVPERVQDRIFFVVQLFPLPGSLRILPVESIARFPAEAGQCSLMLVEIRQGLPQLVVLMTQVLDDDLQVGDMVVRETLHLRHLTDGGLLLPELGPEALQPLVRDAEIPLRLFDHAAVPDFHHKAVQIDGLVVPRNFLLELLFHLREAVCLRLPDAEELQECRAASQRKHFPVLLVEGNEGAVFHESAVRRLFRDPLVVDAREAGSGRCCRFAGFRGQQEVVQDGVQVVDAGSLPGFGVFGFFRQHPQECLLQSLHKGRAAEDLFRYLRSEGFSRDPREGSRFSVFGDTRLRVNDSFLFRLFLLLCAEDPVALFKIADVRDPCAAKGAFFDDKAGATLFFS